MRLDWITVENFKQYFGKQRVDFAKDSTKNITVIHGINGTGKTSLFLAINWCLYGRSVDKVKVIENVESLVNKEAISRAKPGERVRALVQLAFMHEGERFLATRSLGGTRNEDNTLTLDSLEEFTMMRTGRDGSTKRVEDPIWTMNRILPVNVRQYFLFDGEKIDNFAKPEASKEVKAAIYLVIKLEILERARRVLESNAQDYRKELGQIAGGELGNIVTEEDKTIIEREQAEKRLEELREQTEFARRQIGEIDRTLKDLESAKILQDRREYLESDLAQRRLEIRDVTSQIEELTTDAYFPFAKRAVSKALAILDQKRERGEIPSKIRKQFVQDLLDQMICICGRPIDNNSTEYNRLQNLLETSNPKATEDTLMELGGSLRGFDGRVIRFYDTLNSSMKRRTELAEMIHNLESQLNELGRQLKGSPLEEVSQLEKSRQTRLADIEGYRGEIGTIEEQLRSMNKRLEELKEKRERAKKLKDREALLDRKADLAQRAADAIKDIYQAFSDEMREKIRAKAKEIFKKLVWKDSFFEEVLLGPDFNLEVIDRYGLPSRSDFSAGERQVLSLSFITAMSRISEEEAPLVMDTPFGRLSSQHRSNIALNLPDLADQIVLFVTDEELKDEARKNLEPRIGAEYKLVFDKTISCTAIEEGKL